MGINKTKKKKRWSEWVKEGEKKGVWYLREKMEWERKDAHPINWWELNSKEANRWGFESEREVETTKRWEKREGERERERKGGEGVGFASRAVLLRINFFYNF